MASSDVDQKYLAQQAALTSRASPLMSASLYQILGLSVMLARKLVRARRLRRLDTSRDTKSLQLYHHIIWLSREGLSILQTFVLPYAQNGQHGPELQILAAKLQASFFHIFCLFHNNPPISQTSIPSATIPPMPLSPRDGNGRPRRDRTPPSNAPGGPAKPSTLRDPVPSYTSEASYLTNPYAHIPPGTAISPDRPIQSSPGAAAASARRSPAAPPGLAPIRHPTPSSAFIFPPENFLPYTAIQFDSATRLAADLLPGSHPLRLSVAIEHAAFLWDCVKDGDGSRNLARRAIRECHASTEGLSDADFEDAAECVGVLGRMMRREGLSGRASSTRSRETLGSFRTTTPRASVGARGVGTSMRGGRAVDENSPASTRSSPTTTRISRASRAQRSGSGEASTSSVQHSPTRSRASRSVTGEGRSTHGHRSSGSGSTTARHSGMRERKSSHSTKGSSGSAKSASASDGQRRSSSERESSALRGSGVTRGAGRSRGFATSRAR